MRVQNCSAWQLFLTLSYDSSWTFVCFSKSNFFAGAKFNNGLTRGGGGYVTPSEGVKERDKIKLSYIQAFMSF